MAPRLRRSGRRRDRHRGRVLIRHLPRLPGAAASGGDSTFGGARVRASLRGAASARADRWSDFVSPDRATLGEANTALTAQMEQWYAQQPDLLHVPLDGPAPKVVQIVQPQEQEPEEAATSWDQAAPEEGTGSIDAQWEAGTASDGASVYANSGDQVASIGEEWHSLYDSVDPTIPLADDFDKKWRWMDWTQATMQGYVLNSKTFGEAMDRNAGGFIVLHAVNGLGNRIRAFSAAKLLANQRGRKLIVIWERDDSLDAPIATMLTPSFLKDSYIIEEWPERLNAAEAELAAWKARGKSGDRPVFSVMHDATTDWGKSHVGEVLRDPETWRRRSVHQVVARRASAQQGGVRLRFQLHGGLPAVQGGEQHDEVGAPGVQVGRRDDIHAHPRRRGRQALQGSLPRRRGRGGDSAHRLLPPQVQRGFLREHARQASARRGAEGYRHLRRR